LETPLPSILPKPAQAATQAPSIVPRHSLRRSDSLFGHFGEHFAVGTHEPPNTANLAAMEIYKANREGTTSPNDRGREDLDPYSYCFPPGVTRSMVAHLRPFEIVQLPDRVYILFEVDHWVRRIYMDGRGHSEGWPFGWMGQSIGKWDGDTLVVDTTGLNDRTWMDRGGTPHSDALHVVERMRRVNHDTLEIDFLFDDPKAFTKPWGAKKVYRLRPDWEILEHIACEEYLEIGKFP